MTCEVLAAPICPDCGQPGRLVDGEREFGGWAWKCLTKGCDNVVGAHSDGTPFGSMANGTTRHARYLAHRTFDGWWRRRGITRSDAYVELARRMGMSYPHIGEMTLEECKRVIKLFSSFSE